MLTGQMMGEPLLILDLLRHAALCHPQAGIVSRCHDGSIHRYSYAEAWSRVNRLAGALSELSVAPGDRVGTIAWNDYRHFELYYAVSGSGGLGGLVIEQFFQRAGRSHVAGKLPGMSRPDDVVIVDALPHNATGKLLKKVLRDQYRDHLMNASG